MTPKDKAKKLVEQFMPHADWYVFEMDQVDGKPTCNEWQTQNAKQCALIAVDEVNEVISAFGYSNNSYDDFETGKLSFTDSNSPNNYWQQLKAEIEKL